MEIQMARGETPRGPEVTAEPFRPGYSAYQTSNARKRAEQDSILLANRIRLLRAEDEKTRKKTLETEKKIQEIVDLRRRTEERRLAKQAENALREAEENEFREQVLREREEQQKNIALQRGSVLEQRASASHAVRHEREHHLQAIRERRLMEAAGVAAKAENVRSQAAAAARSRTRSEMAKHEMARSAHRDRMVRDEDAAAAKILEIQRMEQEEMNLLARLEQSQERHRSAYMRLEDVLKPHAERSGHATPQHIMDATAASAASLVSISTVNRAVDIASSVVAAAKGVSETSAPCVSSSSAVRPPRPKGGISRPGSASRAGRQISGACGAAGQAPKHVPRSFSSCSTASSNADAGGRGTPSRGSGANTPASAAAAAEGQAQQAQITYTTVDGKHLDLSPEDENLDLNSLLLFD